MATVTVAVTDRIRGQHERIRRLFAVAGGDDEGARRAWRELVRLLAVHETAEEVVVHPLAAAFGAHDAVRARKTEERVAKADLADLESMGHGARGFGAALRRLRVSVEAHAGAEERDVLPVIEHHLALAQLHALDAAFLGIELIGPTHAHRLAPVGALGNLTLGPLVGFVDRTRDLVSGD